MPKGSADAEVDAVAVGLLDELLGYLRAGVAHRGERRVDVVPGEEDPAEGALGEQIADLCGRAFSCIGPPGSSRSSWRSGVGKEMVSA
jgi:hypothetical protein